MAKGKYQEWLTPEGLIKIEGWARDGLTDEQIAQNMGISSATLYVWENKYPEILESLKKGKEVTDYAVESALLRRALGYKTVEVTKSISEETGELEIFKEVEKEVPPDTTAQIFWLKNRQPEKWRDKQDIDVSGSLNMPNLKELSTEELRRLANEPNKE
ncbi:helix-turn-helix domain-containing protein [Lentilactobacillus sp. SPB1-3]|uniref:Helix-turn-helix domain-containing protein n=1 Tax=Lentilactobacillus terminaliae TaxID=3003483 RepID=A0ACD5DCK9_9LACO|nr:helix-turn-helix domain-containing protein [Lentilactobacillus sp. SPB1-3]MCZ0978078.1 helix-turn-helix domain-containing protein [Lentilactobacillus sp. SPB1-3]